MCVQRDRKGGLLKTSAKEHLLRKNLEERMSPLVSVVCCCSHLATKRKAVAK